jgi:hypothetical protein
VVDEVQDAVVVAEVDLRDHNALRDAQLLLLLEDAQVEQLLQLLVAVVDAQLLEAVHGKDLEPEDVQHTNVNGGRRNTGN